MQEFYKEYGKLFRITSDKDESQIFVLWYFRYLITSNLITINLNNADPNRRKQDLKIRCKL